MTERAMQYGRVLYELKLDEAVISEASDTFSSSEELLSALDNPSVRNKEKHAVIDKLFNKSISLCFNIIYFAL